MTVAQRSPKRAERTKPSTVEVSIVMPCLNEAETLATCIQKAQRAIDKLPPGYKTVFVLHDVEGFEHNEIAEMVGCSIGNSKSQLHKARLKLRDQLKFMRAEKAEKT